MAGRLLSRPASIGFHRNADMPALLRSGDLLVHPSIADLESVSVIEGMAAGLVPVIPNITGIILTKMDGTAKGGIAVAIQAEMGIPVKYIGVGEQVEDLQKFDSDVFVNALFDVKENNDEQ